MSEATNIFQCGDCARQHDGRGGVLAFRVCVPTLEDCGRADCAAVCEDILRREAAARERRMAEQRAKFEKLKSELGTGRKAQARPSCAPAAPARVYRKPYHDDDDDEAAPKIQKAEIRNLEMTGPAVREHEFQASGAADSANAILFEFFCQPKNFNVPFRSTDLEAMTAAAGHPSSRMNNRAIWLREKFLPEGLYLDNDPNGTEWGLPNGSYYRLCRIADATSLSEEAKERKLVAAGLRESPQPELAGVKVES